MAQFGGPDDGHPPRPDAPPNDPRTPAPDSAPASSDGGRTSGLSLETCYRHPDQVTGVHCTRCGRPICPDCMRPAAVGYQCQDCLREAGGSVPRRRRSITVGGTGRITRILIAINVAVFVVEIAAGGGLTNRHLLDMGALFSPAVAQGEYWRLVTVMFLHASFLHIALNMYALYILGGPVEEWYGEWRFVAIYFVSGFLGAVASFTFGPINVIGVGASGAIFGLLGAWLIYNFRRRENPLAFQNMRIAGILILLNLVFSFSVPGIDWRAHVGGLLGGIAAGYFAEGFGPRSSRTVVTVAGMCGLVLFGVVLAVGRAAALRHTLGI
jgi:membrane associated rhomboid family serine protease